MTDAPATFGVQRLKLMTDEERKDKLEALRRYEDARREHLSGALNLVFGISAAALGFCVTLVSDEQTVMSVPGSYLLVLATFAFLVTVGLCMLTMWTRLRDFRDTARKLRKELRGAEQEELQALGEHIGRLGKRTWLLFRAQLSVLFVGILLLIVALWDLHHERLFPEEPNAYQGVSRSGQQTRDGVQ